MALPPNLTGTVSIDGTARVGYTLTANTSNLAGSGEPHFTRMRRRWDSMLGLESSAHIGTNSPEYTVEPGDIGYEITVTVSRSGYNDSVTSMPTDTVTGLVLMPEGTPAEQPAWLRANAQSGGEFVIELSGNLSLSLDEASLNLPWNVGDVTLTLRGTGAMRSISLSENGTLFSVGSGLTLVLDSTISLQGRPGNNNHLVRVDYGGTLVMNEGSRIAGNTNTASGSWNAGGGVRVNSGGTFVMYGGEISGNASDGEWSHHNDGGGVHVSDGGIFDMRGGTISGNRAVNRGGGVFNAGTFHMSDGVVYGNDAAAGFTNTASNGGTAQLGTFGNDGGVLSIT